MDCQYNRKLGLACGPVTIPRRRTFDRRSNSISTDVKDRIPTMGCLFVVEGMVMVDGPSITATDRLL